MPEPAEIPSWAENCHKDPVFVIFVINSSNNGWTLPIEQKVSPEEWVDIGGNKLTDKPARANLSWSLFPGFFNELFTLQAYTKKNYSTKFEAYKFKDQVQGELVPFVPSPVTKLIKI